MAGMDVQARSDTTADIGCKAPPAGGKEARLSL